MRTKWRTLLGLLAVLALLAAGCGGDDTAAEGEDTEAETTEEAGGADTEGETEEDAAAAEGDLSGSVVVSGSSTVEPISGLNGELFSEQNPGVTVTVDGPGTGDGFELFCNGETDISDASRPIREEEVAACEEAGIEFIELQVAIDGLAVLTNPANEAVECLANEDIYALVGPESQGFANWSDANDLAEELGAANAPYPDAPLDITAPGEESGTYDSFVELTIADIAEERGQEDVTRPDYNSSPNDNVIVDGITGSETSFGWVGYAFYVNNQDALKAIQIAGEDGTCVEPTEESIADGSYPLARPLFIYVSAESAERPEVEAYVDFYLSDEGMASVAETGYVDVPDDVLEETRARWENRETGAAA